MGMAASQARFLGLTARKTNVEYEGQQVNQQRTTLANQSANYYNQLLGMTVPTPPSTSDFTKTVYTFEDGNLANSITSLIAKQDGSYLVSYISSCTNDFAPVAAGSAVIMRDKDAGNYMVGSTVLRNLTTINKITDEFDYYNVTTDDDKVVMTKQATDKDGNKYYYEINPDGSAKLDANDKRIHITPKVGTTPEKATSPRKYIGDDAYLKTLSIAQIDQLITEEQEYKELLNKKYGDDGSGWFVRYVQNTSTGTWSPMFYRQSEVMSKDDGGTAIYSDNGTSQSNIPSYKMGSAQETKEVKGVKARLEKDATGRYINITLLEDENNPVTYSLTTNTLTDQDAYDDAMNQYEYNKYKYDQSIQEVNAKIEIIQSQDKNLELRLKQLDTEQDAVQTEMDAVQKVIEKNTESTFKTFG